MAQKPTLTPSGLLSEGFGRRPFTVRLREEYAGAPVVLDYGSPRKWRPLGFAVRTAAGKKWVWDFEALDRARDQAEDFAAGLRLGHIRTQSAPKPITVGMAFAMYHDPERGGLPGSKNAYWEHRRSRLDWEAHLGKDTPWNSVTPADVEALLLKVRRAGYKQKAWTLLKNLRSCYNWLRKKKRMRQLEDPTEGIESRDQLAGVVRDQPRYTREEAAKLLAVRDGVDPRFSLFVALIDDTGTRSKAVRLTMRSMVDQPLAIPPREEDYPHGWIVFPPLKGQTAQPTPCTAFMRRELNKAFTTYLRDLEDEYQRSGRDYPLFPAVSPKQVADGVVRARRTVLQKSEARKAPQSRAGNRLAYRPISAQRARELLLDAEAAAGVTHQYRRGYHGLRRAWSDLLYEEEGLEVLTTAGAWSSQRTPESIYVEKGRSKLRGRAREAMERKRSAPDE
jgi:hypothetical protein